MVSLDWSTKDMQHRAITDLFLCNHLSSRNYCGDDDASSSSFVKLGAPHDYQRHHLSTATLQGIERHV